MITILTQRRVKAFCAVVVVYVVSKLVDQAPHYKSLSGHGSRLLSSTSVALEKAASNAKVVWSTIKSGARVNVSSQIDCPAMMEQKYGVERFTRPSFTNDTRKVNFPDGRPVEDAHECLPSLSTKKVAVLVEMRTHLDWVYHVMHFIRTLDDDWPFVIYHSNHNEQMLRSNAELQPHIQSGKVQLHLLKTIFSSGHSVSQFLTHTPFWDALAPADHILIYQIDSTLCASSPHKIEDFFKYDYVGAPLDFSDDIEMPFNGGFSLRNRTAMIHVINHERPFEHPDNKIVWEDRWYSSVMARSSYPYRLPRGSVAATFAVEIRFYPRPAGIHRPKASLTRFSGEDSLEKLLRNCPEGKLMPDDLGGDF